MRRLKYLLASLSLGLVLLAPGLAVADVNDFQITNFNSDQTLTKQDKQGELRIVESIDLVFTDNNHGILRAIPDRYKGHSLQLEINKVSSNSGAPAEYTTYSQNGNTVLKIGDPDKTVTGPQQYTIDYTVRNVISFYDGFSELYWDVNGDQWQQQFGRVSMTLHLPADLEPTKQPLCYTGIFGSQASDCTVAVDGSTVTVATTKPLLASQGLTYVMAFPDGYFTPSTFWETVSEYRHIIAGITIPFVLIGGTSFYYWWRYGRDVRGKSTIVAQYDSPDGLKPLQAGTIMDFNLSNKDITATIIDLAVRGYLKIHEVKQVKKLRKDTMSYQLELRNADLSGLDEFEQQLLKALFSDMKVGETIDVTSKKNKLHSTASSLRSKVKDDLKKRGYFRTDRPILKHWKKALLILVIVILCFPAFGPFTTIGVVAGSLVAFICLLAMDARTAQGVAAKQHLEGLKLYLNVAEKDRIDKLQAPDAAYAAKAGEPKKTVELFEKLLPLAMVLGVEQNWAKQFETLYKTPPDWYDGNFTTFNAAYLTTSLNNGIGTAVNSAFTSPSSSGSSGSSGGSSGGGGGGGGGGGW